MRKINFEKSARDKKGQGLNISTLIIIILAVLVLVVVAFGFTMGWENMWGRITEILGTSKTNVDSVVQACNIACTTQAQYDYCTRIRDVRAEDHNKIFRVADVFVSNYTYVEEGGDLHFRVKITCDDLAEKYGDKLGLEKDCPVINCDSS
jgi:hypothetical protein